MLILAIDTAHKNGSIALARASAPSSFEVIATTPIEGGAFSAQLVPRIAQLLREHDLDKTSIDAYAACVGPGSFTGLRIGLSGIKGLSEVLPRPIAAVSSLEALAAAADVEGPVLALLDAGRGEFYAGHYQRNGARFIRKYEALYTAPELQVALKSAVLAICSQSNVAEAVRAAGHINAKLVSETTSADIARLGAHKLLAGDTVTADALDANYLRRDDALFAK